MLQNKKKNKNIRSLVAIYSPIFLYWNLCEVMSVFVSLLWDLCNYEGTICFGKKSISGSKTDAKEFRGFVAFMPIEFKWFSQFPSQKSLQLTKKMENRNIKIMNLLRPIHDGPLHQSQLMLTELELCKQRLQLDASMIWTTFLLIFCWFRQIYVEIETNWNSIEEHTTSQTNR